MVIDRSIVAAIAAAVLFGISTPLAKLLVGLTEPLMLSGLLYCGSGIGLAAVIASRAALRPRGNISIPRGGDWWWLGGAIAAGGVVAPYLLIRGLAATDAASASLVLNLEGVLTALLAWFVFKENFDRRIAVGMALIVAGSVLLSLGPESGSGSALGMPLIAGACLAWAVDNNLTRRVSIHDAALIACAKGLVAGMTSVTLALATGTTLPPVGVLVQAGVIGFFGYGLSLTLFVVALRGLGTARTGVYFSLAPFIGALVAIALGAPVSAALVFSGVLMAVGVWLHLTERHEHLHRHVAVEHEHEHRHDQHHRHAHGAEWDGREPHSHVHAHEPLEHSHAHYPDLHHRHDHR